MNRYIKPLGLTLQLCGVYIVRTCRIGKMMFYAAWLHDAAALQHLTFDLILLNYPAATPESNHLMLELQTLKNSDIGEEKYPCPPPKNLPVQFVLLGVILGSGSENGPWPTSVLAANRTRYSSPGCRLWKV